MQPFNTLTSLAAPLDRTNVDTDQIIPKQFLKRIERTGYGDFLFFDWRQTPNGDPIPDFVLNDPRYKGAQILIAGKNWVRIEPRACMARLDFVASHKPTFADLLLECGQERDPAGNPERRTGRRTASQSGNDSRLSANGLAAGADGHGQAGIRSEV